MRTLTIVAALIFPLACASPQLSPPAIPSTPPPVPPRPERIARVSGTVVDARGEAVPAAHVVVVVGDEGCRPSQRTFDTHSGPTGAFSVEPDIGMGPAESRCLFVTASAGGSTTTADARAMFAAPAFNATTDEVKIRLQLPLPAPLTIAEADRLIDLFKRTLHAHDPALFRELGTYRGEADALMPGLNDINSALRGIASTQMIEPYVYRLTGRTGQQITVRVEQESLTRIRTEIFEASAPAHTLLRSLMDVVRKGDADRLAAVADTDVVRARQIIDRYRAIPSVEQPDFRLRTIDEASQTLVYAVDDQMIEIGYDGRRVWVRGM
jgi:hypothetical protein